MSETSGSSTGPTALDIARVYARPQPDAMDHLLGTPVSVGQMAPQRLRETAQDMVNYLETRPTIPSKVSDPDAHYQATLGPPTGTKKTAELVDEWAASELENDETRAQDIRQELMQRAERRSLTRRGQPYKRPTARQAELPAYTFNALFDRKERIKQQRAPAPPPAIPTPPTPPPPPAIASAPAQPNLWQRTKTATGNFLTSPEYATQRIWVAAGAVALSYIGGMATVYVAIRHGGIPTLPYMTPSGGKLAQLPPPEVAQPSVPNPALPPLTAPPQVDQSLANNYHTVWAAEQGLYPNQTDAQTSHELLENYATLKAHGWQADYWQNPDNPNLWGFSDTFVAPKDQYLYFKDGHIEHLSGQAYSGTNGTFGALEYADKYADAQVVSEAQARVLSGVPNVEQVGPSSFVPAGEYRIEPAVFATTAPAVVLAARRRAREQPIVEQGRAVAVPTAEALVFQAYQQAWIEEARRNLRQQTENDEDEE